MSASIIPPPPPLPEISLLSLQCTIAHLPPLQALPLFPVQSQTLSILMKLVRKHSPSVLINTFCDPLLIFTVYKVIILFPTKSVLFSVGVQELTNRS